MALYLAFYLANILFWRSWWTWCYLTHSPNEETKNSLDYLASKCQGWNAPWRSSHDCTCRLGLERGSGNDQRGRRHDSCWKELMAFGGKWYSRKWEKEFQQHKNISKIQFHCCPSCEAFVMRRMWRAGVTPEGSPPEQSSSRLHASRPQH